MSKVNLDAFNGRELQNFIQIITLFEGVGLSDIRFVRQKISEALLDQIRKTHKDLAVTRVVKSKVRKTSMCPSCGKGILEVVFNEAGLNIVGCKKCRYSEIKEEDDG